MTFLVISATRSPRRRRRRGSAAAAAVAAGMAAGQAGFRVRAQIGGVFALHAEFAADLIQPLDLRFGKFLRPAELLGKEQKLRIKFHRFHLVVRGKQRIGISQRAVVFQKHRIEMLQILGNGVGDLLGGRGAVFRDGNAAERDDGFGHDGLRERDARDRKRRGIHRVRVHDDLHVRALFVDAHVHFDLRRGLESLVRLQHVAVLVHFADELGRHKPLAHPVGVQRNS